VGHREADYRCIPHEEPEVSSPKIFLSVLAENNLASSPTANSSSLPCAAPIPDLTQFNMNNFLSLADGLKRGRAHEGNSTRGIVGMTRILSNVKSSNCETHSVSLYRHKIC
jgi:hypothetical protein